MDLAELGIVYVSEGADAAIAKSEEYRDAVVAVIATEEERVKAAGKVASATEALSAQITRSIISYQGAQSAQYEFAAIAMGANERLAEQIELLKSLEQMEHLATRTAKELTQEHRNEEGALLDLAKDIQYLNKVRAQEAAEAEAARQKELASRNAYYNEIIAKAKASEQAITDARHKAIYDQQSATAKAAALYIKEEQDRVKAAEKAASEIAAVNQKLTRTAEKEAEQKALSEIAWAKKSRDEQLRIKAEIAAYQGAGVSPATISSTFGPAAVSGVVKEVNTLAEKWGQVTLNTSRARTEMVVLAHEAVQGRFSRIPASMMVFAEYSDLTALALSGVGLAIMGVVASAALLSIGMIKGMLEQKEMQDALITTGNYAGMTAAQLNAMGHSAVESGGSIADAKRIVTELAASGKYTAEQMGTVSSSVIAMGHATGMTEKELDGLVKQFASLQVQAADHARYSDNISKALLKLDDQYHFLTTSVLLQVQALEQEGRQKEASKLATDEFAKVTKQRAEEIIGDLGRIERGWNAIKEAIGNAKSTVGDWGKKGTAESEVARTQEIVDEIIAANKVLGNADSPESQGAQTLAKAMFDLIAAKNALYIVNTQAAAQGEQAQIQSKAAHALQLMQSDDIKLKADRMGELAVKIEQANQRLSDVKADPTATAEVLAAAEKMTRDNIEALKKKFADKKVTGTDTRAKELADALLVEKTALDGEKQLYADREKMLDAYHKKFGMSDNDYYSGREVARNEYLNSLTSSYLKESKLIEDSVAKTPVEVANKQKQLDTIYREYSKTFDKIAALRAADAADELATTQKLYETVGKALDTSGSKELDVLTKAIAKQKEHNDEIGKTPAQIEEIKSKLNDQLMIQYELAAEQLNELAIAKTTAPEWAEIYAKRRDDLLKIVKAQKELSDLHKEGSDLAAALATQKKIDQEWRKGWEETDRIAKSAFLGWADSGKSMAEQIGAALKKSISNAIYDNFMRPYLLQIYTSLTGGTGAVAGAVTGAAGGYGGAIGGGAAGYGAATGGIASTTGLSWMSQNGFSSNFGVGVGNIGNAMSQSSTEWIANMGNSITENSSAIGELAGNLGEALGWINAAYNLSQGKLGAAIGGAVGMYFGPIGSFIGSTLGGWVDKLTGGETRSGGQYFSNGTGTAAFVGGPSGGQIAPKQVVQQIDATQTAINNMLKAVESKATLVGFQAGLETSDNNRGGVGAGGTLSTGAKFGQSLTGSVYDGTMFDPSKGFNMSLDKIGTAFTTELSQSIIEALQAASDVPKTISDIINTTIITAGVDSVSQLTEAATKDLIGVLNTVVGTINSFREATKDLPFEYLKDLSFETASGLIAAAGGMQTLGSNLSTFYDKFFTAQEQTEILTKNTTASFAALGIVMPKVDEGTRAWYRSEIERLGSMDLSVAANAKAYTSALALAGAVDSLAPAFQNAAASASGLSNVGNTIKTIIDSIAGMRAAVASAAAGVASARDSIRSSYISAQDAVVSAQQRVNDLILEAANRMRAFSASIGNFLGTIDPATGGGASLTSLKAQLSTTAVLAQGGDATAQGNLVSQAQAILKKAQDSSRTAVEYASTEAFVRNLLSGVQASIDASLVGAPASLTAAQQLEEATAALTKAQADAARYAQLAAQTGVSILASTDAVGENIRQLKAAYNAARAEQRDANLRLEIALTALQTLGLDEATLKAILAGQTGAAPGDFAYALGVSDQTMLDLQAAMHWTDAELISLSAAMNVTIAESVYASLAESLGVPQTLISTLATSLGLSPIALMQMQDALGLDGNTVLMLSTILGLDPTVRDGLAGSLGIDVTTLQTLGVALGWDAAKVSALATAIGLSTGVTEALGGSLGLQASVLIALGNAIGISGIDLAALGSALGMDLPTLQALSIALGIDPVAVDYLGTAIGLQEGILTMLSHSIGLTDAAKIALGLSATNHTTEPTRYAGIGAYAGQSWAISDVVNDIKTAMAAGMTADQVYATMAGRGSEADIKDAMHRAGVPGYAVGTNYVPKDGMAYLHEGETITPKPYVDRQSIQRDDTITLLRALIASNTSLKAELTEIKTSTGKTSRTLDLVTRGGRAMQTEAFV